MAPTDRHRFEKVLAVADRRHGVVTREQLFAAGLTADAIAHLLRTGHLHRVCSGVYAVGRPTLTREGRWLAAVLACGRGAALGLPVDVDPAAAAPGRRVARSPRRRLRRDKHARLRRVLDAYVPGAASTEADAEMVFLEMCSRRGLPAPECQVPIGRWRADFMWRDVALVVEIDDRQSHDGYVAFQEDRVRDPRDEGARPGGAAVHASRGAEHSRHRRT
jgi:putative AbiEi antitoxin of type IV toxin-antitoxin system